MPLKTQDGSILVSKSTIVRLLQSCTARRLDSNSTLFDIGYEQHKNDMARVLQREFNLDLNMNPAAELIKELSR